LFLPAVKQKGFSFTFEALLSLVVLVIILSVPVGNKENNLEKIYSLQKENDLIKIWIKTGNFGEKEITEDFRKMFPFQKGEIMIENRKIKISGKKGETVLKSSGFYYKNNKLNEISVKVFV